MFRWTGQYINPHHAPHCCTLICVNSEKCCSPISNTRKTVALIFRTLLYFCRNALRNMYDNRHAILEEPLSPDAFRNKGLRLRKKIGRHRKIFEDRLASVVLDFSSKMNLNPRLVSEIAKVWITVFLKIQMLMMYHWYSIRI